jgi:hypothetical protein
MDLSCPLSSYKNPLIAPYAVAFHGECNNNGNGIQWKVRIGMYMNWLQPEVLTKRNFHCDMSVLGEDLSIVSKLMHLPPRRDHNDDIFVSSKYPILRISSAKCDNALDVNIEKDDMSMEEEKKEEDDDMLMDLAVLGST